MGKGTFYGLSMKTPVIYAEIQVLLMKLKAPGPQGSIAIHLCLILCDPDKSRIHNVPHFIGDLAPVTRLKKTYY